MAKVYEFPMKKELPKTLEERIYAHGKEYAGLLYQVLVAMAGDEPDQKEMEEINELVAITYASGMIDAINKIEEEL